MSDPINITQWLQRLPIPWLVSNEVGADDVASYGAECDRQVQLIADAVRSRMPLQCAADALPFLGGERLLIQGTSEADASFRTRLQTAWDDWARAGTALELLVQLAFYGFVDATIVQQNGLYYQLSADPVAGEDPTSLLVIGDLAETATSINPSPSPPYEKVIPAGTPWWYYDDKTDFCSRFSVIFSGPRWPAMFTQAARVEFDGTSDVETAVWPNGPFPSDDYHVQVGIPVIIDSAGGVFLTADGTTKTKFGIDITASDSFTGHVYVLAWQDGDNPFINLLPSDLSVLRTLINRWKPAKSTCVALHAVLQGQLWGWPLAQWGDPIDWGQVISVEFEP